MRIGCCARPEDVDVAAAAGFDYVEPAIGSLMALPAERRADAIDRLERSPVPVLACNVFFPRGYRVVGEATPDLPDPLAYTREALDVARRIGVRTVVYGSGGSRQVPHGFPRERARRQLVEYLRLLGDEAEDRAIRVAIEPLATRFCNVITSVAEATNLAADVAHPAVGVLADVYHMACDDEPCDQVAVAGRRLWHAHVSALDRSAPTKDADAIGYFFAELRRAGYVGDVSIECRWDAIAAEAGPALAFVRGLAG